MNFGSIRPQASQPSQTLFSRKTATLKKSALPAAAAGSTTNAAMLAGPASGAPAAPARPNAAALSFLARLNVTKS